MTYPTKLMSGRKETTDLQTSTMKDTVRRVGHAVVNWYQQQKDKGRKQQVKNRIHEMYWCYMFNRILERGGREGKGRGGDGMEHS